MMKWSGKVRNCGVSFANAPFLRKYSCKLGHRRITLGMHGKGFASIAQQCESNQSDMPFDLDNSLGAMAI
jgi:hypothetical protein